MWLLNDKAKDAIRNAGLAFVAVLCVAAIPFCVVTVGPKQVRSNDSSTKPKFAAKEWPASPKLGVCVPIEVVAVHDGDTLTAEIRMKVSVRMLDCWAPEVTGEEKPRGLISRDRLRALAQGCQGVLMVPTTENLGTSLTFGRVLGYVWLEGDDKSLSQRMVEQGLATIEKPKETAK